MPGNINKSCIKKKKKTINQVTRSQKPSAQVGIWKVQQAIRRAAHRAEETWE